MIRSYAIRIAVMILAFVLASIGFVVALGFGMVGVYFLFTQIASPTWAAFDTAISAILFSVLAVGIALMFVSRPRRRKRLDGSDPSYLAATLGSLLGRKFGALKGNNARASIFASFAAGFAIGASPKLRAFLFDIVRF